MQKCLGRVGDFFFIKKNHIFIIYFFFIFYVNLEIKIKAISPSGYVLFISCHVYPLTV